MNLSRPLRVALFTHSTNPRGGVMHALELGEALHDLGHEVVVHAPDPAGRGFFRPARCGTALVPARPVAGGPRAGIGAMVRQRIGEFTQFLEQSSATYDVHHAQDAISANALAGLTRLGQLPGYLRTVHHLDVFDDAYLRDCQDRSVITAARCFCVSAVWQGTLKRDYGIDAPVVPNGVNTDRFAPTASPLDVLVRERAGVSGGPVFLAVGGVEPRKNTVSLLRAFLPILAQRPEAQLVIVGGASLLDHAPYQREFDALVRESGLTDRPNLVRTGVVPDNDMPALFRSADALVFPSIREGFGLVVLEAMASGTPVICPDAAPFNEYLGLGDAVFVDPTDVASITEAMRYVTDPRVSSDLAEAGLAVSRRFPWRASAEAHLRHYDDWVVSRTRSVHAGDALSGAMAR